MSVNPPDGVNLTVAIFGLVGAALSVVGFFAHYSPRRQYGDFCRVLRDINDIISDYDLCNNDSSELSLFQRSSLYQGYCSMSADLESLRYLLSMPSYVVVFCVRTALRLRSLRRSASQLKIELIALCQIERGKKNQKIMEMSLSSTTKTSRAVVNDCESLPV